MLAVVNVVLPVFAIMAAGYLCGRLGLLGEGSSQALNGFVYYVALPALFFIATARVPVDQVLNGPFLVAYGGGVLAIVVLATIVGCLVFRLKLAELSLHTMSAIFANTGYMGISLLFIAYGEAGRVPAIITSIINGALVMAVATVLLEIAAHAGSGATAILRKAAAGVARSPLVLAAVFGIAASALKIEMPVAIATFCDLLGATAGPAALFAIGLFMVGKHLRHGLGEVLWVTLLKLIGQPLVTWFLAYQVLELPPEWAASAVILAALPAGTLTFVLAQRYNVYIQRATSVILVSTVLSLVTLSLLFVALG
jgi:malonate transporter and related proteins